MSGFFCFFEEKKRNQKQTPSWQKPNFDHVWSSLQHSKRKQEVGQISSFSLANSVVVWVSNHAANFTRAISADKAHFLIMTISLFQLPSPPSMYACIRKRRNTYIHGVGVVKTQQDNQLLALVFFDSLFFSLAYHAFLFLVWGDV